MAQRALLVLGATGTQGGALIDALLAKPDNDFLILAVTRNPGSAAAQRTAAKSPSGGIRLVQGDLDDAPALFAAATAAAAGVPIWGVFSVQAVGVAVGEWTPDGEVAQGRAVVDEALKLGTVRHFVYTSVDRGGDEASWLDPTPIAQFRPKYHIERHLRDAAAASSSSPPMGWTVLRPASFMDNLLLSRDLLAFYAMFRDHLPGDRPLQWVAAADIGWFAAEALRNPAEYDGRAIGLAGDAITFPDLAGLFTEVTGKPFDLLGGHQPVFPGFEDGMKWMIDVGYGVDIAKTRRIHPGLSSWRDWLSKSRFVDAAS